MWVFTSQTVRFKPPCSPEKEETFKPKKREQRLRACHLLGGTHFSLGFTLDTSWWGMGLGLPATHLTGVTNETGEKVRPRHIEKIVRQPPVLIKNAPMLNALINLSVPDLRG